MESKELIYLQEDSRNKIGAHDLKDKYFREHNIKVLRSKLPFGDYAIVGKINLVIDTKKDFLELAGNLTKDHIRFRNEIKLANDFNSGIVILIEENDYLLVIIFFFIAKDTSIDEISKILRFSI